MALLSMQISSKCEFIETSVRRFLWPLDQFSNTPARQEENIQCVQSDNGTHGNFTTVQSSKRFITKQNAQRKDGR